ncbi:MAG: hypothetical protein IKI57_01010 [Clostridia bacterium]|nr:hypothetical protein [Clostridia bacterium]
MKKQEGIARFLCAFIIAIALIICTASANSEEVTQENMVVISLKHGNIACRDSNQYYGERPLIIFFPGSQECNSIYRVINFINNYDLYDDIDADIIVVTMYDKNMNSKSWEAVAEDLVFFLKEKYTSLSDDDAFPIILDAVSFGGYGAITFAEEASLNGIFVDEINLADACNSDVVTAEMIESICNKGTTVNVYASTEGINISRNSRRIIDTLYGANHFNGEVLSTKHGKVLHDAIYINGLHSEYSGYFFE